MNTQFHEIEVILDNRPGALADFDQTRGRAGVSLEGGGAFTHASTAAAHFLVNDAQAARQALHDAGIGPVRVRNVIMLKLDQESPGQLGLLTRKMGDAGVSILTQDSDHEHNLVLIVNEDHYEQCHAIADEWTGTQDKN